MQNMQNEKEYQAPEIVRLGNARQLTEGRTAPNVEGNPGSGIYYNANPPRRARKPAKKPVSKNASLSKRARDAKHQRLLAGRLLTRSTFRKEGRILGRYAENYVTKATRFAVPYRFGKKSQLPALMPLLDPKIRVISGANCWWTAFTL